MKQGWYVFTNNTGVCLGSVVLMSIKPSTTVTTFPKAHFSDHKMWDSNQLQWCSWSKQTIKTCNISIYCYCAWQKIVIWSRGQMQHPSTGARAYLSVSVKTVIWSILCYHTYNYLLYFCWARIISYYNVAGFATNTGCHTTTTLFYERASCFSLYCLQHSGQNKC